MNKKLQNIFEQAINKKITPYQLLKQMTNRKLLDESLGYKDLLKAGTITRTALKKLFNQLARPGIIGPHAGYEADLLISGAKPIGFVAFHDKDWPALTASDKKDQEDTIRLSEAVSRGLLRSCEVAVFDENRTDFWLMRFYCQPEYELDMREMAAAYAPLWAKLSQDLHLPLKKDTGEYLGYTKNDLKLWYGDESKTFQDVDMEVMRWCRVQSMLMNAPRSPEL